MFFGVFVVDNAIKVADKLSELVIVNLKVKDIKMTLCFLNVNEVGA